MRDAIYLNDPNVEALRNNQREYVTWDSNVKSFGVRVQPTGRKSYVVKYRVGGGRSSEQRKYTIGTVGTLSADEARRVAKTILANVQLGRDPQAEKAKRRREVTFADLFDRFEKEREREYKRSTWLAMTAQLRRHALPEFRNAKLSDIDRNRLRVWHGVLKSNGTYCANRALAYISILLSWAVDLDLISENQAKGIRRGGERKRSRYLEDRELRQLGQGIAMLPTDDPNCRASILAIKIALYTGCRPGETLTLRWADYDEQNGLFRLAHHKTDRAGGERFLSVSEPLRKALAEYQRHDGFLIAGSNRHLPFSYYVLSNWWRKACGLAGLNDVRLHDLRHTAATHAASITQSAFQIRDLLGHSDVQMAARYVERRSKVVHRLTHRLGRHLSSYLEAV